MNPRRIAIVFDHKARPETTGVYCRRALEGLADVEQFLPGEMARIPRGRFDLYLNIDDGLRYRLPPDLRPSAWWAIDTHLDPDWCLEKAGDFDVVFAAQREGAARLRDAGIATADWLPLACDPDIHRRHEVATEYDVAFVGNLFPGPREDLLERIRRRFPRTFIGRAYFEEMARVYSAARTAFNRSIKNDVNMRVFEALACGSLLLTNDLGDNGQDELFRDGTHLATYRDADELLDKLAYYLAHEAVRERIAAAGRAEALAGHTYAHRMERMLRTVGQRRSRTTVGGAERGEVRLEPTAPAPSRPYFEHARPELLALIPHSARTVLDIGCGAGRLGAAVQARQEARVVGIERDEQAAATARDRLDRVLVGDVEQLEPGFAPGSFDAIVCGDILEHLRNPERLLRRARGWLDREGHLIASIPNVRHHSIIRGLLAGNWTYESAGLLDRDHLRFFTRREIEKLFFRAGFSIERLQVVPGPGDEELIRGAGRGELAIGPLSIRGLQAGEAEEFYAYQFLIDARPVVTRERGLTSVVILTHDQIVYTRQCVESILRLTDEPYELVFVDNASSDGTVDYLRSIPGATLIVNDTNRGFPAAANQGIAAARGEYVLLLNNDTVVTTGWLGRMLNALESDPAIGMVGPCSNSVSGPQQVEARYDDVADLDGFAWDWGKANDRLRAETDRLVGFCLLIRRSVIDRIGVLDERFGVGCFEDDDYCRRAIRAGFRLVIAGDSFVHHYGGRTFRGSGADFAAIMRENERRYRDKWEKELRGDALPPEVQRESTLVTAAATPLKGEKPAPFTITMAPGGGLLLERGRVGLSLCMIVRDNVRTIRPCLESIRPWVDEMVVVDTGSVDETPGIAAALGARVFHFPWCDDFSAARNESLRHARGEWVFWMDSDDTIDAGCGRKLRELAYGTADPSLLGYVVQVHCPGPNDDGVVDVTAVDHVKLVRNRPDLRFEGRIHEQILPALRRAGGDVAWTDLYVVHSGSDQSLAAQERKRQRDLRLLELELQDRPEHTFTLFNLGMTHADAGRYEEAAGFLTRSIARSGPNDSHLRKAYALLMFAQMQTGRRDEARATCRRGRALFPDDIELRFREGVLLHDTGYLAEAERAYMGVLNNHEERHFASLDRGIKGFKSLQNLAVLYTDMGRFAEAERVWREVIRQVPTYRAGWRGLGDALLRQNKGAEALALAEELIRSDQRRAEGCLLKSRVAAARGDVAGARTGLEAVVREKPGDLDVRRMLCHLLFEHGTNAEAEHAIGELVHLDPSDASAFHNLGTIYLRTHRYAEAQRAYRESLRLRPASAITHLNLGYALKEDGRIREAADAFHAALRIDPANSAASEELARLKRPPSRLILPAHLLT
jgi:GT2 family glycosyltransferase/tetratricopeptide (TPR) repeat protein/2-polyprenyl-3-methyl-5-hydroxy-6-metoxy-1,4-benzoquinol methylase